MSGNWDIRCEQVDFALLFQQGQLGFFDGYLYYKSWEEGFDYPPLGLIAQVIDLYSLPALRLMGAKIESFGELMGTSLKKMILDRTAENIVDFNTEILFFSDLRYLRISNNSLGNLDPSIMNMPKLQVLEASNCSLSQETVDQILINADAKSTRTGQIVLSLNAPPSSLGNAALANLQSKNWIVSVAT